MVRIGSKNPPPRISTRPDVDQAFQPSDIFGMLLDEPFQERTGGVQDKGDLGIVFEHVQERAVTRAKSLLENPLEITHGLVIMKR